MPTHLEPASPEAERAELETVAEALGRSSRLAHLLHYIGDKYFAGESGHLSEYAIATEVFGRSKSTFDASEDAIARVEAHRLRKRLREYYEGPGKNHSLHLAIPAGTYVPSFTQNSAPSPSAAATQPSANGNGTLDLSPHPERRPEEAAPVHLAPPAAKKLPRKWLITLAAVALVAVASTAAYFFSRSHLASLAPGAPRNGSATTTSPQTAPSAAAPVPVRILAGYTGEPQTDSSGAIWGPERYEHGGGAWRRADAPIARTSDPFLFQHWRTGDSFYDIPLNQGVYELHLYFTSAEASSDDMPTFTVKINGNLVLQGFDINSDALGANVADERVFRDVSPARDGLLHLAFTSERGTPEVNAIEILPGLPHQQLPIRLLMQRTSYTDHTGRFWHPDDYFMDGRLSDSRQEITGSPDPDLFSTERYGHFTYAIPVDTRDRYTLILHFVEFYFGPNAPGGGGVGSRVFKVMCNGQTLLDNFDIYKEAGSLRVLTKTFYHLKPSAQGKLNLTFEPIANNASVSGIEVLDENQ